MTLWRRPFFARSFFFLSARAIMPISTLLREFEPEIAHREINSIVHNYLQSASVMS